VAEADRAKWDAKFRAGSHAGDAPEPLLIEALGHAPPQGRALDVACGRGRHAIALARRGYSVDAVDVSPVGLAAARERAGDLPVNWIEADLDAWRPETGAYDAVVCVDFTEPALVPHLARALKPGGVLVFVARPRARCRFGPKSGDVERWFEALETVVLRETSNRIEFTGRRA